MHRSCAADPALPCLAQHNVEKCASNLAVLSTKLAHEQGKHEKSVEELGEHEKKCVACAFPRGRITLAGWVG